MQIQIMLVLMHHLVIVKVITKAPISTVALDVRKANDSQPRKIEGKQLCGIAKSKGTKNYGGTMLARGEGGCHYLLLEAFANLCTRGSLHDQTPCLVEIYQHCHQSSNRVDKWSMYFITYLPLKARMLFGECGSMSR